MAVHTHSRGSGFGQPRRRPAYTPGRIGDPCYVRVLDTTLRDGEQSPGAALRPSQKLRIARQLARLGVDVIEAGFPASSPGEFEAVRAIASEVGNTEQADGHVPVIAAMGRAALPDLERAWDAVRHARHPRVHTFIATSDVHVRHKLRMSRDQVVEAAVAAVTHLRAMGCTDIEFGAEDAGRSDPAFLRLVLGEAVRAGATTLNVPDTTGFTLPQEYAALLAGIGAHCARQGAARGVVLSCHAHNDLGLATANSLAGAMAGARQVECTINGIGERAGNASLEEVVMAIVTKGEGSMGGLWTAVSPAHIYASSRMVSACTGMPVQPHKALVGANAFAGGWRAGHWHQGEGLVDHRRLYEIVPPEAIGRPRHLTVGEAGT